MEKKPIGFPASRDCRRNAIREFWDIVSSYGCRVVYGFDAHSPITLLEAHRIHMAEEILEGIPLNFTDAICLR